MRSSLKTTLFFLIFMSALFLAACSEKSIDILTPEERAWLREHDGKIVIDRAEDPWAPVEALDEKGNHVGIAADYYRLIEKKLGFKFKIDEAREWKERVRRFRSGEIHVASNLQKTPWREEYLLFTEPYIVLPNVIIVRKEIEGPLGLDEMRSIRISVTDGYAVHEYLQTSHGYLDLVPAPHDVDVLRDLASGGVDAAVMNFAVASYLIRREGITNLRIAGNVGYDNELSLASRKDWPILNSILDKGLASITPEERRDILKKWVALEVEPFYMNKGFQGVTAAVVLVIAVIFFWNTRLGREIRERRRVQAEREELIDELRDVLERIGALSGLLPICANCKKIRDDKGYWNQLETYIEKHSDVLFSHGLCSECEEKLYGDQDWYRKKKERESKKD